MTIRLSKHHGLGNDFLVWLGDPTTVAAAAPELARRVCDRHRGVGADGLLVGVLADTGTAGADLTMVLYNADGGRAEMSGNGIRCLAQAEARRRGHDHAELYIVTDGGLRRVTVGPDPGRRPGTVVATVDMGRAGPGPAPDWEPSEPPTVVAVKQAAYDLGNPHLVLLVDGLDAVDPTDDGPLYESCYDAGINVHFVAPTPGAADEVDMRIWERGAGATEACGTGAVAVARAVHDWGLTGERVTVHMPGGDVTVVVGDAMVLTGPATHVADVEVPT